MFEKNFGLELDMTTGAALVGGIFRWAYHGIFTRPFLVVSNVFDLIVGVFVDNRSGFYCMTDLTAIKLFDGRKEEYMDDKKVSNIWITNRVLTC